MPDFRCAGVLLAAGASTRLGRSKQLVHVEGESLLRRTARLAIEAGCSPLYVVLGFDAETMRAELAGLSVETVLNPSWEEGMGSSLGLGMRALRKSGTETDAALLLVCDQPRLSADHLGELLARHKRPEVAENNAITASVYAGKAGVPAVFSRGYFGELEQCSGDKGGREMIRAHSGKVEGIPWSGGEVDLDRPEDLTTIEGQF